MQGFITRRQSRWMLWLTMPLVVAFVVSIILANAFAVSAPPAKASFGGTWSCTSGSGDMTFYGLTNTIHPGEIGFRSHAYCSGPVVSFVGTSCLRLYNRSFGDFILLNCDTKTTYNVLAMTQTMWFSCGTITNIDAAEYDGEATWSIRFQDGSYYHNQDGSDLSNLTATHGSRCLDPTLVQAS